MLVGQDGARVDVVEHRIAPGPWPTADGWWGEHLLDADPRAGLPVVGLQRWDDTVRYLLPPPGYKDIELVMHDAVGEKPTEERGGHSHGDKRQSQLDAQPHARGFPHLRAIGRTCSQYRKQ